jgi:tetratricopeptide (TPR) repeat protein
MRKTFTSVTTSLALAGAFLVAAPAPYDVALAAGGSGSLFSSGAETKKSGPSDTHYMEAERFVKQQDWKAAIAALEKSLGMNSKNADAYNLLGFSNRKMGNYEEAFRFYAKALEIDPKHRGAHEYVGEAYLKTDNLAKAKEHLARLGEICAFDCPEYHDLRKEVIAYEKAREGKSS